MSELLGQSLSDAIVERLREGNPEAVNRLVTFGSTPDMSMPKLDSEGHANVQSLWHWSHWAPTAQAVNVWWDVLEYQLEQQTAEQRARTLAERLEDALRAAAQSQSPVPLVNTWQRALTHASPHWSRPIMMTRLVEMVETEGNAAAVIVRALGAAQCVDANDWTVARRQRYAVDPVAHALRTTADATLLALLDQGAERLLLHGQPLLATAIETLGQSDDAHRPGQVTILRRLLTLDRARMTDAMEADLRQALSSHPDDPEFRAIGILLAAPKIARPRVSQRRS
jgi:hypothetical protein